MLLRLLLGTVVGSTPLRSLRSCKEFGVSFRTLKKATKLITNQTKTLVINFYNSVAR